MNHVQTDDSNYNRDTASKALINTNKGALDLFRTQKQQQRRLAETEDVLKMLSFQVGQLMEMVTSVQTDLQEIREMLGERAVSPTK